MSDAPTSGAARTTMAQRIPAAVLLLVAIAAACIPLWSVYGTAQLVLAIAVPLLVGASIAAIAALRRWRPLATAVAGVGAFEQGESAGLAQRQAVARRIERTARLRRHQFQRVEAEQHAAAQRVDAADHGRVDQAQADQPLGRGEHLGARRASGGDGQSLAVNNS